MKISDLIKQLEEMKSEHGDIELVRYRSNDRNILDKYSYGPEVVGVDIIETSWGGTEMNISTYDMNMKYDHLCVLMN